MSDNDGMSKPGRRVLVMSDAFLPLLFREGDKHYRITSDALPKDARVINVEMKFIGLGRQEIRVLMESAEWEPSDEDKPYPVIEPHFKAIEPSPAPIIAMSSNGMPVAVASKMAAPAEPCQNWPRATYKMTQEQAASVGAPPCPRCGNLADIVSNIALAEYGVRAVACSACGIGNVEGSADRWVPMVHSNYLAELRMRAERMVDARNAAETAPPDPGSDGPRKVNFREFT